MLKRADDVRVSTEVKRELDERELSKKLVKRQMKFVDDAIRDAEEKGFDTIIIRGKDKCRKIVSVNLEKETESALYEAGYHLIFGGGDVLISAVGSGNLRPHKTYDMPRDMFR